MDDKIHFFWVVTDPITKRRRQTRYRMTEKEAQARHGDDAQKVLGDRVRYFATTALRATS
jgi:hypothetical protein